MDSKHYLLLRCYVCRDAYFLSEEARSRHIRTCIVLADFLEGLQQADRSLQEPTSLHRHRSPRRSSPDQRRRRSESGERSSPDQRRRRSGSGEQRPEPRGRRPAVTARDVNPELASLRPRSPRRSSPDQRRRRSENGGRSSPDQRRRRSGSGEQRPEPRGHRPAMTARDVNTELASLHPRSPRRSSAEQHRGSGDRRPSRRPKPSGRGSDNRLPSTAASTDSDIRRRTSVTSLPLNPSTTTMRTSRRSSKHRSSGSLHSSPSSRRHPSSHISRQRSGSDQHRSDIPSSEHSSSTPDSDKQRPGPSVSRKRQQNQLAASKRQKTKADPPRIYVVEGLKNARDYVVEAGQDTTDHVPFLQRAVSEVKGILRRELAAASEALKYQLVLESDYLHPAEEDHVDTMNFKTQGQTLFADGRNDDGDMEDLDVKLKNDVDKLIAEEDTFTARGSGWTLFQVKHLKLKITTPLPIPAPSSAPSQKKKQGKRVEGGSSFIALPRPIVRRQATVNVRNSNEKCFLYAMLVKHALEDRAAPVLPDYLTEESFVDVMDTYVTEGLTFPMSVRDINRFERLNPGVSVNVFELEGLAITPRRIVSEEKEDHTDLLLIRNERTSHYVYIKDFNRLVRSQVAPRDNHSYVICKRCFTHRPSRICRPSPAEWLTEHSRYCQTHQPAEILMPKKKKTLQFENFEMSLEVPIIVVADFEATLRPAVGSDGTYQRHEANSFCFQVHSSTLDTGILVEADIPTTPVVWMPTSSDTHEETHAVGGEFVVQMAELAKKVEDLYGRNAPMATLTPEERLRFDSASSCELCQRRFEGDGDRRKVADHCHITGRFRHPLCSRCNLRCHTPNFIPIYFHNLSYDQSFIIRNIAKLRGFRVEAIAANSERLISFSIKVNNVWLRFLDSYRLLPESLATLAASLPTDEWVYTARLVPCPAENMDLVTRKGVYPYDAVKSPSIFSQTSLPARSAFYNSLTEQDITDADYEHAQNVWRRLGMKTFGDYHTFYLKLDVAQLLDILVSFRKKCLRYYGIDCGHVYTAPGFSWQAMLKKTRVTLDLITDYDMVLMIEAGLRGGLVQCNQRHAKANNRLLEKEDFNPQADISYLYYLDCTNLYGWSMGMPLPCGNFQFVKDAVNLEWMDVPLDSPRGFFLECDIHVPLELHDTFNELPLLPSKEVPPGGGRTEKLLATLGNKERYVVHYAVLQQAVRLGLQVTRVRRAISFAQSRWMESYITFNADLRAQATDAFSRTFFKLLNNSVFGK